MENILVSGGAGYIGSFAANLFIANGYKVTVLDNLSTGHKFAIPKEADFIEVDLNNFSDLKNKLTNKKFDGLIHFAAKALVGESVRDPDLYYHNNVFGSINLFTAAREVGVKKIIFSSTAAVYGEPVSDLVETHQKSPCNPYGHTKLAVENYLNASVNAHGISAVVLRYFNACGASSDGQRGEIHHPETHLIPLVVGAALGIYPTLNVFGHDYPTKDGSAVRDYIHVEDLAEAHLKAYQYLSEKESGIFEAFNLGTGSGYSVLEIINAAKKIMQMDVPYKMAPRREGDPANLIAIVGKVNQFLDWKATRSDLENIISGVKAWMEKEREKIIEISKAKL